MRGRQGTFWIDYFPPQIDYPNPNSNPKEITPKIKTPGEVSREFFALEPMATEIYEYCKGKGVAEGFLKQEMRAFVNYWTEPTKSGKKVRWELQKTFDVKRRLWTWFRNADRFNKHGTRATAGGVDV